MLCAATGSFRVTPGGNRAEQSTETAAGARCGCSCKQEEEHPALIPLPLSRRSEQIY